MRSDTKHPGYRRKFRRGGCGSGMRELGQYKYRLDGMPRIIFQPHVLSPSFVLSCDKTASLVRPPSVERNRIAIMRASGLGSLLIRLRGSDSNADTQHPHPEPETSPNPGLGEELPKQTLKEPVVSAHHIQKDHSAPVLTPSKPPTT